MMGRENTVMVLHNDALTGGMGRSLVELAEALFCSRL
jgi:hypothetical protein